MWNRLSNGSHVVWPLFVALVTAVSGCDAHTPEEQSESKKAANTAESSASSPDKSDNGDRAASGPVRPVPGPELPEEFRSSTMQLPRSTSVVPWNPDDDATQVVVTTEEIRVADKHVVDLPVDVGEGKPSSNSDVVTDDYGHMEIPTLQSTLEHIRRSSSDHSAPPRKLQLAVDRSTPYRTVTRMLYTAGQANYDEFSFVVFDGDGRRSYEVHLVTPKLSPEEARREANQREKPILNLTIAIEEDGIDIGAKGALLPARDDCPEQGPTLCLLRDNIDIQEKVERARKLIRENSDETRDRAAKHFRDIERAYDWRRLYEKLLEIKEKYSEETVVKLSASPETPFYLVVRAMDIARLKLKRPNFDGPDAFWHALWHGPRRWHTDDNAMVREKLFPHPIFAVAK